MKHKNTITKRYIEESLSRTAIHTGFDYPVHWIRGEAKISQGIISLPVDDQSEFYWAERRSVLWALAQLELPLSNKAIIQFVRDYGLLRNGLVEVRSSKQSQIKLCEGMYVTADRRDYKPPLDDNILRENVSLWEGFVKELQDTLLIFYYLKKAIAGDLVAHRTLQERWACAYGYNLSVTDYELYTCFSRHIAGNVNLGLQSGQVVPRIIAGVDVVTDNKNITFADPLGILLEAKRQKEDGGHVSPHLVRYDAPGTFYFSAYTRSLIGLAWHEMALVLTASQEIGCCENCESFFPMDRKGRKWCSKQCGNRLRVQEHRARKREL